MSARATTIKPNQTLLRVLLPSTAKSTPKWTRCKFLAKSRSHNQGRQSKETPQEALQRACEESGSRLVDGDAKADEEEDWEDVMEDFEDVWMRDPQAASDFEESLGPASPEAEAVKDAPKMEVWGVEELRQAAAGQINICILNVGSKGIGSLAKWQGPRIKVIDSPLQQLHRGLAQVLEGYEAVLVTGDNGIQQTQAVIRLTKVFGLGNIKRLDEAAEEQSS